MENEQTDEKSLQYEPQGCLKGMLYFAVTGLVWFPLGLLFGGLAGEFHQHFRRFNVEQGIISPILAGDPAMSGVKMNMYTEDGTATLYGEVPKKEDLDRLRSRMLILFGESRIEDLMYAVTVNEK